MKYSLNVAAVYDRRVAVALRTTVVKVASCDLAYARLPGQQVVRATQGIRP